ncbi:MAG: hypothetical protein ACREMA_08790 [Longimicrobiales bacterium]
MKRMLAAGLVLVAAACGNDRSPEQRVQNASSAELEALRDSVLPRLQVLSGLRQRAEIQMETQPRDSLRLYIEARMNEELPPQELQGIRATYAALGLLPANLDLRKLLLDLYTEQVIGYYDPDSKKLFVVGGTDPAMLRPILVHELVHALQDQHVNLDSLIAKERGNDRQTAAQAAIEGHATMVMLAHAFEKEERREVDPRHLPDISAQARSGMDQQFPVFRSAPRILRETMLFPYAAGAQFVKSLWIRSLGAGAAVRYPAPIGDRLPQSTEQVLHPDSRFLAGRDEPTELRFTNGGAEIARENSLGELETALWLSEHLGAAAARYAQGWDGDRYRLIRTDSAGGGSDVLIWYSVWDNEGAASSFANAARRVAQKRGRASRVERLSIDGRPGVRVIDGPSEADIARVKIPGVSLAL